MSNSLIEVKAVLDEVMEMLDNRTKKTHRILEGVSHKLLRLSGRQHSLPEEISRGYSRLISHLSQETHPEICVAEIKRFYGALLAAIQLPKHCKTK